MALEDIEESLQKTYKQKNQAITDNSLITLVAGEPGKRVKIMSMLISGDTASEFALKSGSNMIFNFHAGANWGTVNWTSNKTPLFYGNVGEDITIQNDQASLDANVYIKYVVEA